MGDASGVSDGKQPVAPYERQHLAKPLSLDPSSATRRFWAFGIRISSRRASRLSQRGGSDFEFRVSDFFRHSLAAPESDAGGSFVIRHSSNGVTGSMKSQQSAPKK